MLVMTRLLQLRRLALVGSGLTFGAIAFIGIAAPRTVAAAYGLSLPGVDGLNEFHAIFTGFWAALCAGMLLAAARPQERLLGDVLGLMILLQSLGRFLSMAVDGRPGWTFIGAAVAELVSALAILAVRFVRT